MRQCLVAELQASRLGGGWGEESLPSGVAAADMMGDVDCFQRRGVGIIVLIVQEGGVFCRLAIWIVGCWMWVVWERGSVFVGEGPGFEVDEVWVCYCKAGRSTEAERRLQNPLSNTPHPGIQPGQRGGLGKTMGFSIYYGMSR